MKILFIEFKFPSLFLGLGSFLALILSTQLYAHSFPENHSSKTTESESNPLKNTISNDSIVWVQNALFYNQDSLFIHQEIIAISDSIPHKKQTAKIYIASGTTIINADNLQNASLVYLDASTSTKKVLQKEKKKITEKTRTETVSTIETKPDEQSLLFIPSKSKEHFSSHFGNDLAILILSTSYKILKSFPSFNLQYAIKPKVSTLPYLETLKDWGNHTKSKERAPPLSISVLV